MSCFTLCPEHLRFNIQTWIRTVFIWSWVSVASSPLAPSFIFFKLKPRAALLSMSSKGTEIMPLCMPTAIYKCMLVSIFIYKDLCKCKRIRVVWNNNSVWRLDSYIFWKSYINSELSYSYTKGLLPLSSRRIHHSEELLGASIYVCLCVCVYVCVFLYVFLNWSL